MKRPRANDALPALVALALAGCVTETPQRQRGMRVTPSAPVSPTTAASERTQRPQPAAPVPLPERPIAQPALTSRTTLSRTEVGVVPLGTLTNDGQSLPLVSPDGRFIAVQGGEAPTWEVILAEPGAAPPMRTTIGVYQVGERELTRVTLSQPLPTGLVLGRGSDQEGFLVEAPQPDGSRWIGRVSWLGALRWLVQGNMVNSSAVLTPRGDLVYVRRPLEGDQNELVVLSPGGQPSVRGGDGGSYEFPMCTSDSSLVYALRLTERSGIELEAVRLERAGALDGPARFGASVLTKVLQPKADRLQAYQITAGVAPAVPSRGFSGGESALALFHPRMGRMAALRLESGQFEPLAPGSMSAVPSQDAARPGFYCTTQEGLVFQPHLEKAAPGETPTIRVLPSPYVGRRLAGAPESMMLFGPVKGRADELEVVKLVIGPPTQPEPAAQ